MNKKITIAIILILVLALVAGGFWVWQKGKQEESRTEISQEAKQEESQQVSENELVWYEVSELGIRFKVSEEIKKELIHSYAQEERVKALGDGNIKVISFSFKSLVEANSISCDSKMGPVGSVVRTEGQNEDYANDFSEKYGFQQLDKFFIYYIGPQAVCADGFFDTEDNLLNRFIKYFLEGVALMD